jgi:hypothetical protein
MRIKIVSAADTSHGLSLARLAGQCAELMPNWEFAAYDLGLTDEDVKAVKRANPAARIEKYPYRDMPVADSTSRWAVELDRAEGL